MAVWKVLMSSNGAVPFTVKKEDLEGSADGMIRSHTARLMIVYCNYDTVWKLYKTESTDDGTTWSAATVLVSDIVECVPAIVQDSYGVIWVYYIDLDGTTEKLYRIKSENDGSTWSAAEEVTEA